MTFSSSYDHRHFRHMFWCLFFRRQMSVNTGTGSSPVKSMSMSTTLISPESKQMAIRKWTDASDMDREEWLMSKSFTSLPSSRSDDPAGATAISKTGYVCRNNALRMS